MKRIKNISIDESKDLEYNLAVLRTELKDRYSFRRQYDQGLDRIRQYFSSNHNDPLVIGLYTLAILPWFIMYLFSRPKIKTIIRAAERELIDHYSKPETKVRQSKLQCVQEQQHYLQDLAVIEKEQRLHREYLASHDLGENIRAEVEALLAELKASEAVKRARYEFYVSFEKKLLQVEEQLKIRRSIEQTREKLRRIEELPQEDRKLSLMEEEYRLYDYYSSILDEISANLKKLEAGDAGKVEELELQELLEHLNNRR